MYLVWERTYYPPRLMHHALSPFNYDLCRGRECPLIFSSPAAAKTAAILLSRVPTSGAAKLVVKSLATRNVPPQGNWLMDATKSSII